MRRYQITAVSVVSSLIAIAMGCHGGDSGSSPNIDSATAISTTMSAARQQELAGIQTKLAEVQSLDAAAFATKYNLPFTTSLGYDPLTAQKLDLIQASPLALNDAEKAVLGTSGFVITARQKYPTFVYGYEAIYTADLPVYVSADSILYAVHKSFDFILSSLERAIFSGLLTDILGTMHTALGQGAASDMSQDARQDIDVYLTVALSLLNGAPTSTNAGGDAAAASALFTAATNAAAPQTVNLFGVAREVDFTQFVPRAHYAGDPVLQRYFRAIMWLAQIEFRLIETQSDGSQLFRRRSVEAAYVLRALFDARTRPLYDQLDTAIGALVGEHDDMTVPQLDLLLSDLKLTNPADLTKLSDQAIAQAIVNGGYGAQRIASQLMVNGMGSGTLPLSSSFFMLGQRYTVDSHVFSNVVYDRVQHGSVLRYMPSPLDVGFAAFANNQAGLLEGPEIAKYQYAPDLASMRVLVDAHPSEFWTGNLYNEWVTAIRALSPTADVLANPSSVGMPRVTGTEPWARRILSTQLASWAELRHDTLLYAKQSQTFVDGCEYPDAYVDPYPDFFAAIGAFAQRGIELIGPITATPPSGAPPTPSEQEQAEEASYTAKGITAYFTQLHDTVGTLESMARNQRSGVPHSADQIAFINKMTFNHGCGQLSFDGWYAKLFLNPIDAITSTPTIADVHTDPNFAQVLHVATGQQNAMVVTVESCTGPHAYVGVVSDYHEQITENDQRLTDEDWETALQAQPPPPDIPWMSSLIHH